ncbi:NmrA family NAD(P)-binding protein [Mesorhizobium sp. CAU 1732]|uniref:NmrA family NAD(P)-binding protein n=1 Tax=Mesorhizobium sp. CAU 1732 TaxID=3140358 RepID=UPI003260A4CC
MDVIFGANGRAGGETAKALLEGGRRVRVVLRRAEHAEAWRARGADVAIADMEDADTVAAALEGASGAFLINPPPISGDPYRSTEMIGTALAQGARHAGLRKAIVLSSVGAQHASGTGVISTLHRMETLLADAAPAIAFLRPGYYVETWSEVADAALGEGVLPTFIYPDLKIPMVSTIDVGRTAAALLGEEWIGKRVIELGGPDDWSAREVADAFATVLGRPVMPAFIPGPERANVYAEAGVPAQVAEALLGMYDGLASGRIAREGTAEYRRGTTSLETGVARIVENVQASQNRQ